MTTEADPKTCVHRVILGGGADENRTRIICLEARLPSRNSCEKISRFSPLDLGITVAPSLPFATVRHSCLPLVSTREYTSPAHLRRLDRTVNGHAQHVGDLLPRVPGRSGVEDKLGALGVEVFDCVGEVVVRASEIVKAHASECNPRLHCHGFYVTIGSIPAKGATMSNRTTETMPPHWRAALDDYGAAISGAVAATEFRVRMARLSRFACDVRVPPAEVTGVQFELWVGTLSAATATDYVKSVRLF